ncbi:MAG: hypothetical protein HXX13_03360 [Bacteroidetes bacterium]|nr:hypothetical protein [Bacteroidota bacterium]
MKIKLLIALLPVLAIIISACKKEDNQVTPETPIDTAAAKVYVAGYWGIRSCLWVDGVPTMLSEPGLYSEAYDVKVSGSDVYVCGFESKYAVYWKNGKRVRLSDGSSSSRCEKLFLADTNVYVIGYLEPDPNKDIPKLWVNGIDVPLNIPEDGRLTDVFVSGNNVYLTGWYRNSHDNLVPYLWKNGVVEDLTDGSVSTVAKALYVNGSDVYIAGYEVDDYYNAKPFYWKNGIKSYLLDAGSDSQVSSIFSAGSDLYIGGYKRDSTNYMYVPVYWKNGGLFTMGHSDAFNSLYRSFFLYNNDMYATGQGYLQGKNNKATYSKNDNFIILADTTTSVTGEAIFVK